MADGHPDLQGIYDLATLTPVERPAGTPLLLSDEQAAKLEKRRGRKSTQDAPIQADRDAPPGRRRRIGRPGRQRRRLQQFLDRLRLTLYVIDGQRRASIHRSIRRTAACRR